MKSKKMILTAEQRQAVDKFLFSLTFDKEHYWSSYRQWPKGGRGWDPLHQGGTGIMQALMWYHHRHKVGSKEWRPKVIITALLKEVGYFRCT